MLVALARRCSCWCRRCRLQADAMSRVVQGVIAGIGFLGAGTILKNQEGDEGHVKGLTTAAGLWMTAAIGVSPGWAGGDGGVQYGVGVGDFQCGAENGQGVRKEERPPV
jgi:uncharacterized membrane protein YhiD involved in acid resistance